MEKYVPKVDRYMTMQYNRCGKSGLKLPAISLGLWHNFGGMSEESVRNELIFSAFDNGITHFDLANNYGPPAGSAEINFGETLKNHLSAYRDQLIISTKAGYYMWEGPYGDFGSKKYITSSLDQSLNRMGLDYVDIFYHHRPDPETPLEETACTLDLLVRQGKALYIGISNYGAERTEAITKIFDELKTPFIIHQPRYNIFDRFPENGLVKTLEENGKGMIVFSPLAQGMLTDRYINGVPEDSRAKNSVFLKSTTISDRLPQIKKLNQIAQSRGQSLAQMSISWLLNKKGVTSVLIGASKVSQLNDNLLALKNTSFTAEELALIEKIAKI